MTVSDGAADGEQGEDADDRVEEPARPSLRRPRRTRRISQAARTSTGTGHTQESWSITEAPGANAMSAIPVTPRMPAGTSAQRCGCSVNRVERRAMSAQPMPQPRRAAPVIRLSPPPDAGPMARTIGSRKPTISDAATTGNRRRDGGRRAFGVVMESPVVGTSRGAGERAGTRSWATASDARAGAGTAAGARAGRDPRRRPGRARR